MRKFWLLAAVFVLTLSTAYAQPGSDDSPPRINTMFDTLTQGTTSSTDNDIDPAVSGDEAAESESLVSRLDAAVKTLAEELNKALAELEAEKIIVNQFVFNQQVPPLANYWINQLNEELVNITDRSFDVLSSGATGADWIISGEIVEVANLVRVYTRLVNFRTRVIEAALHSDIEKTQQVANMLVTQERASGSSASSGGGTRDSSEPDSWENPVQYEVGDDDSVEPMSRTIHAGDEDFFLLIPHIDGRLTVETTGSTDTYMYLYLYDTEELLDQNDDGGQSTNSRIRYTVEAGVRYLVKIRGYSSSTNGSYNFIAYVTPAREGSSSWANPVSYEIGFAEDFPVVNFDLVDTEDETYILLVPARDGRLTMETTGNIDTYMYLYDYETKELLDENDDGAQSYNARIRIIAEADVSYLVKIRGYGSGDTGSFGFRAYFQGQGLLPPDEFEPDNEPSEASSIETGVLQQHSFDSADDVDWVTFQITEPGRYVIRTRGARSNSLDTYIELFDANLNSIAEDDDGGSNLDSRLLLNLDRGTYFLKVWCLDDEPDQPYNVSIIAD